MEPKFAHLKLARIPGEFKFLRFMDIASFQSAVQKLLDDSEVEHYYLFNSPGDYSMVVPSSISISGEEQTEGWIILTTVGPMPFGSVQGLIAHISGSLIKTGIGVCVVSSFNCDLFMVRASRFTDVEKSLRAEGWSIEK